MACKSGSFSLRAELGDYGLRWMFVDVFEVLIHFDILQVLARSSVCSQYVSLLLQGSPDLLVDTRNVSFCSFRRTLSGAVLKLRLTAW
jgi:hypothetical protein